MFVNHSDETERREETEEAVTESITANTMKTDSAAPLRVYSPCLQSKCVPVEDTQTDTQTVSVCVYS